ncbi:MAG: nucleotidyltransferase domain-containing protein [Cytophagales bacterium]|nr:nucleotidyltransferase domain-containing protein [Cytophagales bacterium]
MDKGIAKIINKYILHLQKQHIKFDKVYLFGSYAKLTHSDASDIDIALIYEDGDDIDNFDLHAKLLLLAYDIDTRIEPYPIKQIDFTTDNPLAMDILKTGKEVKIKQE